MITVTAIKRLLAILAIAMLSVVTEADVLQYDVTDGRLRIENNQRHFNWILTSLIITYETAQSSGINVKLFKGGIEHEITSVSLPVSKTIVWVPQAPFQIDYGMALEIDTSVGTWTGLLTREPAP